MPAPNSTLYASDVFTIDVDRSGYRRNTNPVLINKSKPPVKPPVVEPPIVPTTPEITCAGALPVATPIYVEGTFELVVDGVLLGTGTIDELKPIADANGIRILPTIDYSLPAEAAEV